MSTYPTAKELLDALGVVLEEVKSICDENDIDFVFAACLRDSLTNENHKTFLGGGRDTSQLGLVELLKFHVVTEVSFDDGLVIGEDEPT